MKHRFQKIAAVGAVLLSCAVVSGCGCGKAKKPDEKSQGVMEITITPQATPTPEPGQMNPAAVSTNGNLTMVNGYLANKPETASSAQADPQEAGTEADGAGTDEAGTDDSSEDGGQGEE